MPHRRAFLKGLAATALATAASTRRVAGANDRVRVGFIGIGLIGRRHLLDFQAQADCEIAGICEVSEQRRDDGVATAGNSPAGFEDFRRMLDRADIDAVVVSTPDHWHALMTIMACAAGKDVYVEKPLTHVLREGEWMIEAARRHRRVVQVGTQQRAGAHYQRAKRLLQEGHIGEIRGARVSTARNILPGFTVPVGKPLSPAQWDMWLGPAPLAPYEPTRGLYHFRWFWDYSGGQTTNLLAHEVDIVQWVTGQVPRRVAAFAQRRSLTGVGETPDVFEGIFEYPGFLLNWSSREVAAGGRGGLEMYGTKGTLAINRRGFEILPDPMLTPESQIPRFTGPVAAESTPALRCEAVKDVGYDQVRDQFRPHVRNFLDCVKSRQTPLADLEGAHQTSVACHLANISMRTGRVILWDPASNDIVDDPAASALLTKTYRAPWDQHLRGAMGSA
ncbi:MAG: Gfo/Idh/MocA family oxidoreductase [Vicinamibacteria bacterium]|nr:Gfo/Idh/MocA family oxidoreductase [Vicinamibacteria bacterium]